MTEALTRPVSHPRVIRIPPSQPSAATGKPAKGFRFSALVFNRFTAKVAALAGILLLLGASATEIWRQSSYVVRQFDMRPRVLRMTEAERAERGKMGLAAAARAYAQAYAKDPGGRALGFSQAEMSYYGRAPFLSYFDAAAVPLLQIADKDELWRALRAQDIHYVLQPGYPLAELNNSAFDALLGDPRLTDLTYQDAETRLLRILDAPAPLEPTLLYAEGTAENPLRLQRWSVVSPVPPKHSGPSRLIRTPEAIVAEIPQHPLSDRVRWDYVRRGWPVNGAPPAFSAPLGRLRFSMEVTARGRIDLVAVNLTADRRTTGDTLVWAGILTGERKVITGQIFTPENAAADENGLRPMGITLRGYRSGDITVHNWKVEWFPPSSTSAIRTPPKIAEPKTVAETAAAAASPVTVSYVLPSSTGTEGIEALLGAGEITATLSLGAVSGAKPEAAAICLSGKRRPLSLSVGDGGLRGDLPCWPRALRVTWPSGKPPLAPRVIVPLSDSGEHVISFVELSAALPAAGAAQ